ncbi:uncharacterized protein At1g76070 [Ipomoea triloba]|uniref:uncharacterized protein At1g76070 n=1 Tax=Ipomoea triloba TaxID=35885 RepID=UPI00125D6838|nr:uncharacterized protein At1g76070 [Ipomoea triloba]
MEKPVKPSKAKMILKFLPKSAAISFQSLPFSPGRDKRPADIKTHCSGPIISIIPAEARRKSGMDTQEPSSPKVSCIGQIKHKKKQKMQHQKRSGEKQQLPTKKDYARSLTTSFQERSSSSAAIGKIFHGRRSDASAADSSRLRDCEDAPSLGKMKRFASGRETLSDFNWTTASTATAQVVPHARKCCLDDDDDEEDEYEEIIIPFSAPMFGGHGSTTLPLEPRKEINLWKRRTMAQPKPLQLNAMTRSK